MRKIFLSIMTIGIVGALAFGASRAFFSDSEKILGNEIIAGDITIDVTNGPDSELVPVSIEDMKPSYVRWTKHTVTNTGTNPLRLWKRITNVVTDENTINNPEQEWYDTHNTELVNGQKNDIDKYIEYDMYIGGTIEDGDEDKDWLGGHNVDGQVIISEDDGITLADIESVYVYLGELAPEGDNNDGPSEMVVWQSYHMKDETENWAQTDIVTFDIEFYGEQANGTGPNSTSLLLENKDGNWDPIIGDGIWGILKWDGDKDTFDYDLKAYNLSPTTGYSLIYYADEWAGNHPGALLGTATTDGSGYLEIPSGTIDLGMDLPHPDDDNYPVGAKIWLVSSSDYNSASKSMTAWNPDNYLFEYNLITYDDTNAP